MTGRRQERGAGISGKGDASKQRPVGVIRTVPGMQRAAQPTASSAVTAAYGARWVPEAGEPSPRKLRSQLITMPCA